MHPWILVAASTIVVFACANVIDDSNEKETREIIIIPPNEYQLNTTGAEGYQSSKFACYDLGMTLLSLETENEYAALIAELLSRGYIGRVFWTSGNDLINEGSFYWDPQHVAIAIDHWTPGQPNNYMNQDCVLLDGGRNFTINDYDCSATFNYICEQPS